MRRSLAGVWLPGSPVATGQEELERLSRALASPPAYGLWDPAAYELRASSAGTTDGAEPRPLFINETERGPLRIAWDGSLYNEAELRQALGVAPETAGALLVLAAWERWGPDSLERFNGDFAGALFDEATGELYLIRDRLGVRPLFYAATQTGLFFASELQALLARPGVARSCDPSGLLDCFAAFQPRAGRSLYDGIAAVEAGTCLRFSRAGDRLESVALRYWSSPFAAGDAADPDLIAERAVSPAGLEEILELARDAVRLRLPADAAPEILYSGGRSALLLARLAADAASQIRTLHFAFPENPAVAPFGSGILPGEREEAAASAAWFGAEHRELLLSDRETINALPALAMRRSLPVPDAGEAGLAAAIAAAAPGSVLLAGVGPGFSGLFAPAGQPDYPAEIGKLRFLFRAGFRWRARGAFREYHSLDDLRCLSARSRYAIDRLDRLSRPAGVEVRLPFCDHRLVEALARYGGGPAGLAADLLRAQGGDERVIARAGQGPGAPAYPVSDFMFRWLFDATKRMTWLLRKDVGINRVLDLTPLALPRFESKFRRGKIPASLAHTVCAVALTFEILNREYDLI